MVNILLNSLLMSGFFFYGPTEKISDNYNFFFVGMIITAVAVVTVIQDQATGPARFSYQSPLR